MKVALAQAKEGRLHILGEMNKVIAARARRRCPSGRRRSSRSRSTRRRSATSSARVARSSAQITEETGTHHRHRERRHGQDRLRLGRRGPRSAARIELITADVEVGRIYEGKVAAPDGLRRVRHHPARAATAWCTSRRSAEERVEKVVDKLKEGDDRARQGARGRPPGPRAPVDARRRRRVTDK